MTDLKITFIAKKLISFSKQKKSPSTPLPSELFYASDASCFNSL